MEITGRTRREERDLYPSVAVREVLNNAVAHADYAVEGASIFVWERRGGFQRTLQHLRGSEGAMRNRKRSPVGGVQAESSTSMCG